MTAFEQIDLNSIQDVDTARAPLSCCSTWSRTCRLRSANYRPKINACGMKTIGSRVNRVSRTSRRTSRPNHRPPVITRRRPNGVSRRPGVKALSLTASPLRGKLSCRWIRPAYRPMPRSRVTKTSWCKTCGSRRTISCSTKRSTTRPAPGRPTWRSCRQVTPGSLAPASRRSLWSSTMPATWPSRSCWTLFAASVW